jgi:hypothetical protein
MSVQSAFRPPFQKTFRETGKDFELRVRRDLKKKGYKVSKAENRHYDWLAKKKGKTYLVECKNPTARLSKAQEDFFFKAIKKGKKVKIARKTNTGRIKYTHY